MRILLLNDTTLRKELEASHEVRACGPVGTYPMPDQSNFDITLPTRTELSLREVLESLGHFKPELIIHTETTTNFFYRGIENAPCPTVWRTIDNHIHPWQPTYSVTHDLVLVSQKDHLPRFQAMHPRAFWLPLMAFPQVHHDRGLARTIDVAFVGSQDPRMHPERVRFFQALRQHCQVSCISGLNQTELSEQYNRAKIVVNQCVHRDLNYRVFEAMANGALLLTPKIDNGLLELFSEGKELVTFPEGDVAAAAALCQHTLAHDSERIAIAARGQHLVLDKHTVAHRTAQLMAWVERHASESFEARDTRLSGPNRHRLLLLMAALYSKRFASPALLLDVLAGLRKQSPQEALRLAHQLAEDMLARGGPPLARPIAEWILEQGRTGAALLQLGRLTHLEGESAAAIALLEESVQHAPGGDAWYWLASCHLALKNLAAARDAVAEALRLEPHHGPSRGLQAQL